jgi:hypothetical protein
MTKTRLPPEPEPGKDKKWQQKQAKEEGRAQSGRCA